MSINNDIRDIVKIIGKEDNVVWFSPALYSDHLCMHIIAPCVVTAANGKDYRLDAYATATIMPKESRNQSTKKIKLKNALITLQHFLVDRFKGRTGLRGYRGYFKLTKIRHNTNSKI